MRSNNLARHAERRRRRQTRLTFEPTNENNFSSPAAFPSDPASHSGLTPARVRYFDPSSSASLPIHSSPSASAATVTPRKRQREEDDDGNIFTSGKRFAVVVESPRRSGREGIGRFGSASVSSPLAKGNLELNTIMQGNMFSPSAAKRKLNDRGAGSPAAKKTGKTVERSIAVNSTSEEDDDVVVLPTPRATQQSSVRKRTSRPIVIDDDDESSQSDATSDDDLPEVSEIMTSRLKTTHKTHRKHKRGSLTGGAGVDDDDDDEEPISSPLKRRRRQTLQNKSNEDSHSRSSPLKNYRKPTVQSDDEESDRPSPSKNYHQPTVQSDDDENDIEEGPSRATPRTNRFSRQTRRGESSTKKTSSRQTRQSEQSTKTASSRQTRRSEQSTKKARMTPKEKALAKIRAARNGEVFDDDEESSPDVPRRAIYDSDSDLPALENFEDESDPEQEIEKVRKSLRPANRNQYDSDFVDDDDEEIGVPDLPQIPLQFTNKAHKPLKEHFRDAVEYFVQKKINPLFNKDDEVYIQAFKKLKDEARGLANSTFTSSAWVEPFARALWARPTFCVDTLTSDEKSEHYKCEACNRTKHPPSFKIQFTGQPYYEETLELVENGDDEDEEKDDDDDDDTDEVTYNENGNKIVPESKVWYVGRFCKANAETAHILVHWKWALNTWILGSLENNEELSPEKLAQREKMTTKERRQYANRLVDNWERKGEIRTLYKIFRETLDGARNTKPPKFGNRR